MQLATLHPPHGKQIDERTPGAIADIVLRGPVPAGMVADRGLTNAKAFDL
jgi:hypothetical protein